MPEPAIPVHVSQHFGQRVGETQAVLAAKDREIERLRHELLLAAINAHAYFRDSTRDRYLTALGMTVDEMHEARRAMEANEANRPEPMMETPGEASTRCEHGATRRRCDRCAGGRQTPRNSGDCQVCHGAKCFGSDDPPSIRCPGWRGGARA